MGIKSVFIHLFGQLRQVIKVVEYKKIIKYKKFVIYRV